MFDNEQDAREDAQNQQNEIAQQKESGEAVFGENTVKKQAIN